MHLVTAKKKSENLGWRRGDDAMEAVNENALFVWKSTSTVSVRS
jgi:hypothetical protein